jgi:hypothetical protein
MSTITQDPIREAIKERLTLLRGEVSALEAADRALNGTPAKPRKPAGAKNGRRRGRKRKANIEEILGYLEKNPESSTMTIAHDLGFDRGSTLDVLSNDKRVKRTGRASGTRWSVK